MGLIEFIILVAILGVIVWLLVTYIPMPEPFSKIIIFIAVLVVILVLLRALGFDIAIPRLRS